jgi:hypothetical protein
MHLNASIVFEDLRELGAEAFDLGDPLDRHLEYFSCYEGEWRLRDDCLYVAHGQDLPEKIDVKGQATVISIGDPPGFFKKRPCHTIRLPEDLNTETVIAFLASRFHSYDCWDRMLHEGIRDGCRLSDLAKLSLPFFRKPISLYSKNFLTLFYEYDRKYGELPEVCARIVPEEYVPVNWLRSFDTNERWLAKAHA